MRSDVLRSGFRLFLIGLFSLGLTFFFYISHQLKEIKEPLIRFLKSQIQGDIQITEAKVSFFPPGIKLKGIKLFAPNETEPAADIEKADLGFKLFPLIHKNIETRIYIKKPQINMVLGIDGKNNFEKIFEPLLTGQKNSPPTLTENLWWKRLSVDRLVISDARFSSSDARNATPTEIQNLDVEANDIRLESSELPARIKISFDLPRISRKSVKIQLALQHDLKQNLLKVQEGSMKWGPADMSLGGQVMLPNVSRKNVELDLNFSLPSLDLKDFVKILTNPLPILGDVSWQGKVSGTAFAPVLNLQLDSKKLIVNNQEISRFHAEIQRKDKVIEISKAQMDVLGGGIDGAGTLLPEKTVSGSFKLNLKSLSLAEITGKPHPAKLSGNLDVKVSNVGEIHSASGEGDVSVGPIPLPVINLKDKLKIAEIISDAALQDKAMNLGFLSTSANVIGTQVDSLNAHVIFSGEDLTLNPYRLANSFFSASGDATIKNKKNLRASGMATLSSAVTTLLIPDHNFRSALTGGKGALSVPFHVSGTVDNPDFAVDAAYFKSLIAKAAAATLKNLILGDQKPGDLLNSALQGSPLSNLPLPQKSQKNSKPKNFEQFLFGH